MTREFWRGRRVFVTGHTGFKGGWLSTWLIDAGSLLTGYALPPDTSPSLFNLCGLGTRMTSVFADVRDAGQLRAQIDNARPEVVFHLAAQPLVRRSLREPVETFEINVMGTAHLLDAVRHAPSVKAVVIVTSDKCYDLHGASHPLREDDRLGGDDPYSASKACAELLTAAFARSYSPDARVGVATARAGNVFGGGDWAEDRLIPDALRALERREPLELRQPEAVRPWQHVIEPVQGYLVLAQRLHLDPSAGRGAWNFGPEDRGGITVSALVDLFHRVWGAGEWRPAPAGTAVGESATLRLDSSKAARLLGWRPRLSLEQAMEQTVEWYREAGARPSGDLFDLTRRQIAAYESAGRMASA